MSYAPMNPDVTIGAQQDDVEGKDRGDNSAPTLEPADPSESSAVCVDAAYL